MTTIFDNDYYSNVSVSTSVSLKNTRIGYENGLTLSDNATATATNSEAGYDIVDTLNTFTFDFWKPSSLPVTITYDAGKNITADYLGLAAHNLSNCTLTLSYSLDTSVYTEAAKFIIENNNDLMLLFDEVQGRYFQLLIEEGGILPTFESAFESATSEYYETLYGDNTGGASLGVTYIGKALAMQRMIYGGHTPGTLADETDFNTNKSEAGQWLGRSVVRRGYGNTFDFQNLTASWYRQNFDPFTESAKYKPFFVAWRPLNYANENLYAWTEGDIVPSNQGVNDFLSVSMSVKGYNGND